MLTWDLLRFTYSIKVFHGKSPVNAYVDNHLEVRHCFSSVEARAAICQV